MTSAIQATAYFLPDTTGGTEVYVDALARNLARLGCGTTVVAASRDLSAASYVSQGLAVHRYPWAYAGAAPHAGFDGFLELLDRNPADIYHQHSWSGGCSYHHLRAAKERGYRTVTTVHLSGNVCLTGTMMRMGLQPCDGRIDAQVCGTCWATTQKGFPAPVAAPMIWLARAAARSELPLAGGLGRLNAAFDGHCERFDQMVLYSDRIIAVCQWLYDALLLNGVSRGKLVLCRQGVGDKPAGGRPAPRASGEPLRVGFLGRFDPIKGLLVLVRAIRRLPADMPVELRIHGVANGSAEIAYAALVRRAAGGDPRILFQPPVAREAIWDVLAGFDVLAVPSQVLETGPLVVLEGLAAGVPVLGSGIGGIAELVTPGVNGWLVAHDAIDAWADELARLCNARDSIAPPAGGAPARTMPVRTMRDVARETMDLYSSLTA